MGPEGVWTVCAYKAWMHESGVAEVLYGGEAVRGTPAIVRTVQASGTERPRVRLDVDPGAETACHAVGSTETNGILVALMEMGVNTDRFSTVASGLPLGFSFGPRDPVNQLLEVREGDTLRGFYSDTLPAGTRVATAEFGLYDSDGDGIPDLTELLIRSGSPRAIHQQKTPR